jgi:2'-5' RNA ligase
MALAVCLLFDVRTEQRLVALWRALEAEAVPTLLTHTHRRHVPHLSYAVLREYDVGDVRQAVARLPEAPSLSLHLDAVAWFRRGRAALVPAVSGALVARQGRVVEAVATTGAELHRHYEPGRWIPHVSLATRARRGQVGDLAAIAYDVLPLTAMADRAALVDSSTGDRWPLDHLV